ncbi:bifunctional metallophosphatase/5'-nucleotidase [Photobacterium leiognathi]|uniref:Bifunctional metallophosphatase/5'-nucleotidase n=1 Tax=Photobacterium leiognathi TaxID=553611 RepID=A0A2T3M752_PHOLE|nr:5'-nucleotidase C-terminal domain-containing protein [Photobacterium leiognathi]KJF97816.1 phosphatase [Photobacterium leiognathi]PSV87933.1 bifunctional metallophosphatase/5'-nucleotidase [Photobacterium leiognathi]
MSKFKILSLSLAVSIALFGCNDDEHHHHDDNKVIDGQTLTNTPEVVTKSDKKVSKQTITLAATSDLHGRLRGYDYAIDAEDKHAGLTRIATILEQQRTLDPNLILFDIGDTVQGNSAQLFNDMETHPMIEALQYLDYDLWVPGNHEFNFDRSFVDRNLENFDGAVISSNIKWESNNENYLRGFQIFNVNGCKVAVIGLTPSYVPNWEASAPEHFKGLKFEDELVATSAVVDDVIARHQPDIIVGALHLGRTDQGVGVYNIAAELADKFDVIMAGHEHATYIETVKKGDPNGTDISVKSGLVEDKAKSGAYNESNRHESVKIIEPGKWGSDLAMAKINVEKDASGKWKIIDTTLSNLDTKEIAEDQNMVDEYQDIHDRSVDDARETLGKVDGDFVNGGGADEATNDDYFVDDLGTRLYSTIHKAKVQDSALIDLIQFIEREKSGATISAAALFSDTSNLRDGQDYQRKDSANLYKYDNALIGVNITGANLKKYMEWSYNYFNTYKEGDLTVSFNPDVQAYNYDLFDGAIEYTVDLTKPTGERVDITLVDGKAFDPNAKYKLALNSYRFGTQGVPNGWFTKDDVFYDSSDATVPAIRDMITAYVTEHNGISINDEHLNTTNNWQIKQLAPNGEITQNRANSDIWKQFTNQQLCIHINPDNVKYPSISHALNMNDPTSYFENKAYKADGTATKEALNLGCSWTNDPNNKS